MPRYLGQHFLQNEAVVKKIIAAVDPRAGETIIEVGPGRGALTIPLAAACAKSGAKLIAVEKDAKLAEVLRENPALGGVEIVKADILEFLKGGAPVAVAARPVATPQKIVGNIPYYLTGHLLRAIGDLSPQPTRAVFTIQKEVAERICAEPPRMNRLAASVQFWAEPKIIARVPRGDFSPPPEVDSAVIALETKGGASKRGGSSDHYYAAVHAIFAQPRKMLINNLVGGGLGRDDALALLRKFDINEKSRPQDLSVEKIVAIAAVVSATLRGK